MLSQSLHVSLLWASLFYVTFAASLILNLTGLVCDFKPNRFSLLMSLAGF
jgi:hypothetical protein